MVASGFIKKKYSVDPVEYSRIHNIGTIIQYIIHLPNHQTEYQSPTNESYGEMQHTNRVPFSIVIFQQNQVKCLFEKEKK